MFVLTLEAAHRKGATRGRVTREAGCHHASIPWLSQATTAIFLSCPLAAASPRIGKVRSHSVHIHTRSGPLAAALRPCGHTAATFTHVAFGQGPFRQLYMRSASLVPPCDSISHSRLRSGAWDQRPHSTVTLGHGDAQGTHSHMSRSSRGATSSPCPLKYQRLGFRGCGPFSHAGGPDAGSACSGSRARPCKSLLWWGILLMMVAMCI